MATCTFRVESLELTKAHDGIFRGLPEPVILIAIYGVGEGGPRLLRSERLEFKVTAESAEPMPWTHAPWQHEIPADGHLATLLIGMEEDSGDDIARVEAALKSPDSLQLWRLDEDPRVRVTFAEADAAEDAISPSPVDVENQRGAFSASCAWDKWVGACLWVEAAPHEESVRESRLHQRFRGNDWTMRVRTRVQ
ncbi:MAG: hypothetical protein AB8H86_02970 [Polyangiales bacterium]